MSTERVNLAIQEIDSLLDRATPRCTQFLIPFAQKELEESEIYACFELWWNQNYSLGYNKFFVKETDGRKELDIDSGPATPEGESFLPEILEYFDHYYENLSKDTEFTQEEGINFSEKLEGTLLKWFADCWHAADGENSKVPTYFCFEKEYKVRDLKTGEVMSEDEAAHRLGHNVT